MIRSCAYKEFRTWWTFSSSFTHIQSQRWRQPSFSQSQPSLFPPVPLVPCSISHPFPLLHCIFSLSLYLTCLLHPKILSFLLSSYNYSSFFLLISSNKLLEKVNYSHHLSFFLSPTSNLASLPSIPPKRLSVYLRPYFPRLLHTI